MYTQMVILGQAVALGSFPAGERGRSPQPRAAAAPGPGSFPAAAGGRTSSCFLGAISQRSFLPQDAQEENRVMLLPL